jgi:hypothetical protein
MQTVSLVMALAVALGTTTPTEARAAPTSAVPSWLPAIWQMTKDEDKGPLGELVEFTADGQYVFHGRGCMSMSPIGFHMFKGNVYVTNVIPDKGPVSVIFRPIDNKTKLSFTSPRTFNNAFFKKTSLTACVKQP